MPFPRVTPEDRVPLPKPADPVEELRPLAERFERLTQSRRELRKTVEDAIDPQ
jgi:hypothetical protein